VEQHNKVDAPEEQPDVYKYVIDNEGWLVMVSAFYLYILFILI
jgi:hypothetical protein